MTNQERVLFELVDHVEMEHERELGGIVEVLGTTLLAQIRGLHNEMHRQDPDGDQYGHVHKKGQVVYTR